MAQRVKAAGAARSAAAKDAARPRQEPKSVAPAKAAPKRPTAAKPLPKADNAAAEARVVVRLKELTDRILATVSVKKKDARPVIEATLKHIGDALDAGEALILPPLGRLRVNRTKPAATGDMLTLKLKRQGARAGAKQPARGLAEDAE